MTSETSKMKLALMGEFSAGKSTLANLLLEQSRSPMQVTATQLPPIWYSHGEPAATRQLHDGMQEAFDVDALSQIPLQDTQQINVSLDAEFLQSCDLIDMPGTSDPNMTPSFWERILPDVDAVIWCTPANQAWRQSEAALWEHVPAKLWKKSLLLITRVDKLRCDRDRARLTMRVRREVDGLFHDVLPVSLTRALAAEGDSAALEASGAPALLERIGDILESLGKHPLPRMRPLVKAAVTDTESPTSAVAAESDVPRIIPRRVTPIARTRARPEARVH